MKLNDIEWNCIKIEWNWMKLKKWNGIKFYEFDWEARMKDIKWNWIKLNGSEWSRMKFKKKIKWPYLNVMTFLGTPSLQSLEVDGKTGADFLFFVSMTDFAIWKQFTRCPTSEISILNN